MKNGLRTKQNLSFFVLQPTIRHMPPILHSQLPNIIGVDLNAKRALPIGAPPFAFMYVCGLDSDLDTE